MIVNMNGAMFEDAMSLSIVETMFENFQLCHALLIEWKKKVKLPINWL